MGGWQQCGDKVAAHLDAGHVGVTRRVRARGPGQHYGPAGTGGSAEARTAIRSCPARRAVGVARCSWWPGNLVELRVVAPQNPHKSGSAASFPTESPRTKRHSPAHGGTGAKMALLALTSLYAGSAGLAILKLPVVRASTDPLKSGRSTVRSCP